jgi:hypothetical protein
MYLGSREAKLSQVFAACLKPPAVQISIAEPPDLQRRIWSRFVRVRCFSERHPIGARLSASKWDTHRAGESHPPTSTGTSITYDPHMILLPLAWGQTFTGSHAIYNHGEKSDASIAGCRKFSRINMNSPPKIAIFMRNWWPSIKIGGSLCLFYPISDTFRCSRQILICPSFSAAEWNDAVPCPGGHLMHLYIAHEARQSVWPILSTGILKLGRMRTFAGVTIFIMRKQDGTIEYIDIINIIMIIITSQGKCRFVDSTVWLHPKKTAENPRLSSFSLAHRTSLSFSDLSWMPASALDPSSAKADCWWNWWPFGLK